MWVRPAGLRTATYFVPEVPERLIGDKAYDSDRLDERLMKHFGTEMIAPNRENRRVATQDGRVLRRLLVCQGGGLCGIMGALF